MSNDKLVRDQLGRLLDWEDAHVGFDTAIADILPKFQGLRPEGLPHSPWEILEHLRRAQHDILDFCINSKYKELKWPQDYWPASPAPPSAGAWDESVGQYRRDRDALKKLAADMKIDLGARIPHGQGQTYLRELVLVADHGAYHIGELVIVRRLLGIWDKR